MKKQIEELENKLNDLKKAYEDKERQYYEIQDHKHFDKDDIVTNGSIIGIVLWIENLGINYPYEKGYMGVNIINGHRGFGTFKRDEFELVTDPYYTTKHEIRIQLTGIEIEELKYSLGPSNFNPCPTKTLILSVLDSIK